MIRKLNDDKDIAGVMEIWLETNISAHPFIAEDYWKSNFETVKSMLPQAEIYIYENENTHEIEGFIGISGNHIEGIFVRDELQSNGIGSRMIKFSKSIKRRLTLNVYQKNERAIGFYEKAGFQIRSENMDENTGEIEYFMTWNGTESRG